MIAYLLLTFLTQKNINNLNSNKMYLTTLLSNVFFNFLNCKLFAVKTLLTFEEINSIA